MPVSLDVLVSICKVSSNKYSANLSSISLKTSQTIRKKNAYKIDLNLEYFFKLKNKTNKQTNKKKAF